MLEADNSIKYEWVIKLMANKGGTAPKASLLQQTRTLFIMGGELT
ncbi:hypothetical protein [Staphylococcus simulans]|nr:hypothetical protein [Staphylococcus simulans]